MAWTLSGEAMHKVWHNNLLDNGKTVMDWAQLSEVTKTAWNVLAATVVNDLQKVTGGGNGTGSNSEDKLSWILGMTSDKEKDRLYKLLYNMGCRIH